MRTGFFLSSLDKMMRKFLSDEEKAELDDRCRRYSQWRQSIALEDEEEELARDQVNLNAQEMTKPSLRMGKTTDVRPRTSGTSLCHSLSDCFIYSKSVT